MQYDLDDSPDASPAMQYPRFSLVEVDLRCPGEKRENRAALAIVVVGVVIIYSIVFRRLLGHTGVVIGFPCALWLLFGPWR